MPTPVIYLDDEGYDQLHPNDSILRHASLLLASGNTRAWFVLPEYDIRMSDYVLPSLEETLDRRASYVFKVYLAANVRTARKTLETEYHHLHGGVYLFDLEDFVDRLYSVPLGQGCHTHEGVLATRNPTVPGVVTYSPEEWKSEYLRGKVRSARSSCLDVSGILFLDRVLSTTSSIREQHEQLFNERRRDLLVFDSDFLPDSKATIAQELRFLPDATNDQYVHVWHCRNPVNGLVYGHGAPKLFPRKAQLLRRPSHLEGDYTLSVGAGLVEHEVCLGTHVFNWSEFSTWRAAAKEVAKLRLVSDTDAKARERHDVWTDKDSLDRKAQYADLCLAGAQYGSTNPKTVLSSSTEGLQQAFNNLRGA